MRGVRPEDYRVLRFTCALQHGASLYVFSCGAIHGPHTIEHPCVLARLRRRLTLELVPCVFSTINGLNSSDTEKIQLQIRYSFAMNLGGAEMVRSL